MENIFNKKYISGSEVLFYTYLLIMFIIVVLTIIFVIKVLKKYDIKWITNNYD